MISWGLILVAAGLFSGSRPLSGSGPPGHLTSPLLEIGGAATALLGLGLMVLASRRDWLPGTFVLVLLSWLSFVSGLAILAYAIVDYQPSRNVPILLGAGMAILISIVARLLERFPATQITDHAALSLLEARRSGLGPGRRDEAAALSDATGEAGLLQTGHCVCGCNSATNPSSFQSTPSCPRSSRSRTRSQTRTTRQSAPWAASPRRLD